MPGERGDYTGIRLAKRGRACYNREKKRKERAMDKTARLVKTDEGLALSDGKNTVRGDFTRLLPRIRRGNLTRELLVRAVKIKGIDHPLVADATAGLGEDSFLLAAAGCRVLLFEYDPVIADLLSDALERAKRDPETKGIAERMTLIRGDSIPALPRLDPAPDVVLLDPMFPERTKSALVKKKFQLLHQLERPCENESALLDAALAAHPKRVVIKRPAKGPYLAGVKPSFSLTGSAVRFDCIVP
ncbi:MAG: class I SAM-dependent methyltransferase [Clostridia bacterium]|nr:class I SAM-dependent methyltransferase [Clostridia bacterium]